MPKFIYTAKSTTGQAKGGEIVANDEKSIAQQLRSEGFLITSIKEIKSSEKKGIEISFLNRFQKVPLKEKMIFARNLSVMISSGLTVSNSVSNLSLQTKNKNFQKIIGEIHDELQKGKAFSDTLAQYPATFSDLFVNMVRVGETGGNLDEALKIIATQLEKEHEIISKVRGALVYPAVILIAMVIVGIIMLTYILPKLMGVFADMDVELPTSTKVIIAISDFLRNNSILTLIIFIAGSISAKFFLQTKNGKKTLAFVLINAPALKNLIIKTNCARFSRIYSSLLRSGVGVVDSLKIVGRTLTNFYYTNEIDKAIEGVQKGQELSTLIAENQKIFPILVSQMIRVGEQTGKTEVVLEKLAEFYEDEVNQITKNMSSIIEPILMLVIGGAVGFFAVSMLQPMYGLLENI